MAEPIGVVTFMLRDIAAMDGFFSILEYYNLKGVWPPLPVVAPPIVTPVYKVTGGVWFRSQPVIQTSTALVVLPAGTRMKFIGKSADGTWINGSLLSDVGGIKSGTIGWTSAKYLVLE